MSDDGLKLTIYFGERDRADGMFLADALGEIYARHELQISLVMRGIEGFGVKHHLHTDRVLTLSEDLPLVSVAVDRRPRIEAALADVDVLHFDGLVTLERARTVDDLAAAPLLGARADEAVKLTSYVGRHERAGGRPAYEAAVALMHRHGLAGATVLLGVDGTAEGVRRRASFFGANAEVPLMIISVGAEAAIANLLPELGALLPRQLLTLERVQVCKRDGLKLAEPHVIPGSDPAGLGIWQKLMVHTGGQATSAGHPVHDHLVRALRRAGASGATTLRGIWGYHGDHEPHGDSFRQVRRRVPLMTVIVDAPERCRRWFELIDELTAETGLVTSEMVPAFRATGPGITRGGLRLARLMRG